MIIIIVIIKIIKSENFSCFFYIIMIMTIALCYTRGQYNHDHKSGNCDFHEAVA